MKVGRFDISGSYVGDCRDLLRELPDACVQTCVTSPPYWGLRDYGVDGQIGLEASPRAYVDEMVRVFEEVRRVLRDDGTLWLNLGDSYVTNPRGSTGAESSTLTGSSNSERRRQRWAANGRAGVPHPDDATTDPKVKGRSHASAANRGTETTLKHKDLVGIPWMVAFALRDAGWWLRMDIIWSKTNPMPESITDRPTKAHEYIFLMSKSQTYFYDNDAIKEPAQEWGVRDRSDTRSRDASFRAGDPPHRGLAGHKYDGITGREPRGAPRIRPSAAQRSAPDRNKRSVWTVSTKPFAEAHFATFNPELITPCILAGSRPGDLVLDPFFGSGTTGKVAEDNGRLWLGFDLNPAYQDLQKKRTAQRGLCFAPITGSKEG